MRRPVKLRYFGELKTTKRPQNQMCPHKKRPRTLLPQELMQIFCSFSYVAFFRFGIFPSGEFGGSQRKKARPAHRRKKMRGKRQSQPSPLPSLRGNQREIFKHVFWLMPALRIFPHATRTPSREFRSGICSGIGTITEARPRPIFTDFRLFKNVAADINADL